MNKIWNNRHLFLLQIKERLKKESLAHFIIVAVFSIWVGFIISGLYTSSQFQVIYSLDHKANDKEIVKVIDDADKYVYFAIYYFTKDNIADALIRAKKRGLEVSGITDRQVQAPQLLRQSNQLGL
jgi:phosphatidylserine/phosphatidylglycerophosphate/cardiolipin synthase-like enzyme